MQWIEFCVDTAPEAVDWIRTLLATMGYPVSLNVLPYSESHQSAAESSNVPWEFTVYCYLPYEAGAIERAEQIERLLMQLQRTGLTTELQIELREHGGSKLKQSAPIHRVGQRFVVLSSQTSYEPDEKDVLLHLDPSLAFGTGFHPATSLSLSLIERHLIPTSFALDLGSGTGILSVAMAKLGADVMALDNDRIAVQATQDAVNQNGVADRVTVMEGSLGSGSSLGHWMNEQVTDSVATIQPEEKFDLIVANILGRIHVALAPDFRHALRRSPYGGLLIVSGFNTEYEPDVAAALTKEGFNQVDREQLNEWVALVYRLGGGKDEG